MQTDSRGSEGTVFETEQVRMGDSGKERMTLVQEASKDEARKREK